MALGLTQYLLHGEQANMWQINVLALSERCSVGPRSRAALPGL